MEINLYFTLLACLNRDLHVLLYSIDKPSVMYTPLSAGYGGPRTVEYAGMNMFTLEQSTMALSYAKLMVSVLSTNFGQQFNMSARVAVRLLHVFSSHAISARVIRARLTWPQS